MVQSAVESKQLRSCGLIVGGIFALLGLWPVVRGPRLWALLLAGVLTVLAFALPRSLRQVYRLWMALGHVLGWLNTRALLGVAFYGLFVPIGLGMRMLGKDPMRRTGVSDTPTRRVVRQPRPRSHMTHQF